MNSSLNQPWLQYNRPFVRDLAFSLACPNALKIWIAPNPHILSPNIQTHSHEFWQQQYQQYAKRLHELDTTQKYKQLTTYLMSRPSPYRLGFHFEGLMHFWLEDGYKLGIHPYEVLTHNMQIYSGKLTIGELDFILRNHDTNEVEHWELAIKFYLGSPPYALVNWLGINSRDNLERKMMHMQSKPFCNTWVDIDMYHMVKIDKRYVVMKGRFFKPANEDTANTFKKPSWLSDTFPLHNWYEVQNTDDFKKLNMPKMRPTRYIEWFTKRPFYDAQFLKGAALNFEEIDTNLYMNEEEPVVLVLKQNT